MTRLTTHTTTRWISSPQHVLAGLMALMIALLVTPTPTHAATSLLIGPSQAVFTAQPLNTTSPVFRVTVYNGSGFRAPVGTIAVSGPFAQTNSCPLYLSVFAQCPIDITFRPPTAGLHTGALTRNGVQAVRLWGEGLAPVPAIKNVASHLDTIVSSVSSPTGLDAFKYVQDRANEPDFLAKLEAANNATVYDEVASHTTIVAAVIEREIDYIQSQINQLKGQTDELSNEQQIQLLRLQSMQSKHEERHNVVSTFTKKMCEARDNIIRNMQ